MSRAPNWRAMSAVASVLKESKTTISSAQRRLARQSGRGFSSLRVRMIAVIIAVAGTAREQRANRSYEVWTTPESAILRPIEHELHPLFVHDDFVGRRRVTGVAWIDAD